MMNKFVKTTLILLAVAFSAQARQNVGQTSTSNGSGGSGSGRIFAGCTPSKSRADLDINNVRTPIWINGDMWWDLVGNAEYEVPKGSGKNSLFAGAIWIGGKDAAGNLKVAAQTYRQSGSDFWPGPVDTRDATITADVCSQYDKHWKITKAEVKDFKDYYDLNGTAAGYPVSDVIKSWPGNGDVSKGQDQFLAPFVDRDNDGFYNWESGDYPKYDYSSTPDCSDRNVLLGDQTIWWVFNDVGNIHTETESQFAVGLEIRGQAFAFSTTNEINNMTFYRYQIINRSSTSLNETYFGAWVDPDLGNYVDDYVGCDVTRGFGYCYNGDADDDGALGYGANPPAIGMDFFEGPVADPSDGIDNDRDSLIDAADTNQIGGEQIIMSRFVYYNNDGSNIGNPNNAQQYYNYLRGIWKDGSPLVYGGNGYQTSGADSCDFMFPGDTDPNGWGTNGTPLNQLFPWSETEPTPGGTPNQPDDRRFLQSAGSFTLQPGAVNYITTGAVWARASSGGPLASVKLLRITDNTAQDLFNNCFKVLDGPDAPNLVIRELDREVIFSIVNPTSSNNYRELYSEIDKKAIDNGFPGSQFTFEGYKIFQLKDAAVSVTDLTDADKARLVFQCDIKNGVSRIVNQYLQAETTTFLPVVEVEGADEGLKHSFRLTTDAFATGDPNMVNHKTYYFMAIAYGYNKDQEVFDPYESALGKPYLQGRRGADGGPVKIFTAIPHIPAPEAQGLVLNTSYGDGPEIQRINGVGNGYNLQSDRLTMDLKQDQIDDIIFNASNPQVAIPAPVYQRARGPVDIRIYDPVKVAPGEYVLFLQDTVTASGKWKLRNVTTGQEYESEKTLEFPYDQLFPDYGFYISMNQVKSPGETPTDGNGFAEGTISYSDANSRWLSFAQDLDNFTALNWIRAGNTDGVDLTSQGEFIDGAAFFEKILNGSWAPYRLTNTDVSGGAIAPAPGYSTSAARNQAQLKYLPGVDIVFTPDKSKWSRCVVFEMQGDRNKSEGRQYKNLIRKHPSLNLDGTYSTTDSGFSWFPGYAINVETGERLNIAFGEDSYLNPDSGYAGQTGADMKFNPTTTLVNDSLEVIAGGRHVVYVFGHTDVELPDGATGNDSIYKSPAYDGCQYIYDLLWPITTQPLATPGRPFPKAWADCQWVGIPMAAPGATWLANTAKVRLRVTRPYRQVEFDSNVTENNFFPYYKFNTYDLVSKVNQTDVAKNALDLINIVPNPYYAYSMYEKNQLDNRVKITNLPSRCTISIFTPSGTLVRKFDRNVASDNTSGGVYPDLNLDSSLEWDLKNTKGIPVASGMYIIHVEAPGIGERTLKWFGVMRPLDLDTF